MTDPRIVVIGVFPTFATLEVGVQALKNAGFRNSDVSVLYPEKRRTNRSEFQADAVSRRAPTGAGALVGGVLGWLAGAGTLVIPGIEPLIAAGPIVATLAGVGVPGMAGGIASAMVKLGIPESDANAYDARLKEGGTLLSVHPDNDYWATRAREIMEKAGAHHVSTGGKSQRRP